LQLTVRPTVKTEESETVEVRAGPVRFLEEIEFPIERPNRMGPRPKCVVAAACRIGVGRA
jgi:hypothetical protein